MHALARTAFVIAAAVAALAALPAPAAPSLPCASTVADRQLRVPILMYHLIDEDRPGWSAMTRRLTVSPGDFAAQMEWLDRHRYHTVTQQQLLDALECGSPLASKPVMVTFDDGYRDVFFNASAVLARLHMHATAYVITGRISGPDPSFLTWGLLHALERRGIEIGSHTVTHAELTGLSDQDALDELVNSRKALERKLGHQVPWFAYPGGTFDARIERLAREAGYLLAVTTVPGTTQSAEQPLALQRLRVLDSTGVRGLAAMLEAG